MKYVSSRNKNEIVESHNAIIQGLAKDGGLFTPENINIHINVDELTNLSYQQIATKVIHAFLDDFTEEEISALQNWMRCQEIDFQIT
jgi:threonine synthase